MAGVLDIRAGRAAVVAVFAVAGVALLAVAPANAAPSCAGANLVPTTENKAQVAKALTCLINQKRRARGLKAVRSNKRLQRAARKHSQDMVARHYFAHQSSSQNTLVDRARAEGYLRRARAWWLGENIAWGQGSHASAVEVLQKWLRSAPHRANLFNRRSKDGGIGIAPGTPSGGSNGATYTLMLGQRG